MNRLFNYTVLAIIGLWAVAARSAETNSSTELARQILADQTLRDVHHMAQDLRKGGLNAGSGYGEIWIRDLNTFITIALEVQPPPRIREGPTGDIVDGYIPVDQAKLKYVYRTSPLAPAVMAHKNTVETDQESSLMGYTSHGFELRQRRFAKRSHYRFQ